MVVADNHLSLLPLKLSLTPFPRHREHCFTITGLTGFHLLLELVVIFSRLLVLGRTLCGLLEDLELGMWLAQHRQLQIALPCLTEPLANSSRILEPC